MPPRLGDPVPPSRLLPSDELGHPVPPPPHPLPPDELGIQDSETQIYDDPEIQIYEDQTEDAAAIARDDDVDPPDRSDRMPFRPLTINIMGVDYGNDEEVSPLYGDENDTGGQPGSG